jgi:hypothetical protein
VIQQAKVSLANRPMIHHWQKPPTGYVKLNWDATIDALGKRMGEGIVARDHEGKVLIAQTFTQNLITDPATAKAIVAWRAVELGIQMGWWKVIVDNDSLAIVHKLNSAEGWMGSYGFVIHRAKELPFERLEWRVAHVIRYGNTMAHRLARLDFSYPHMRFWT